LGKTVQIDTAQAGTGRILALDIGEVRTGLALSDAKQQFASALQVLETKKLCANNRELQDVIDDYEIATILVGLPLELDGSEGSQARRVRNLAAQMLSSMDTLRIIFFDERLSSKEATAQGHEQGLSTKDMRGKLDAFAAAVFLQAYLDTIDAR